MDTEDDDTTMMERLQEAFNACELQHQRVQAFLRQWDDRMQANDGEARAELIALLSRARQRRDLFAAEVIDAVFEIVGESPPQPPPLPKFTQDWPDRRPRMDVDDDPLLLGERRRG